MCHLDREQDKMRRVFPGVDRQACGKCSYQIDQVIGVMESVGVGFQLGVQLDMPVVFPGTGEIIVAPKTATQGRARTPRTVSGTDVQASPDAQPNTE